MRAFSLESGELNWSYSPPQDSHVLSLNYEPGASAFVTVEWPFREGGTKKLLSLGGNSRTAR